VLATCSRAALPAHGHADIVLGIALLIFFVGAGFTLGLTTIVIGHCTFLASYVCIVVGARLAGMGTQSKKPRPILGRDL
jgi:spermidine/putrescine transport system permease protein